MQETIVLALLSLANQILAAVIVITSFSLLVYIFTHNFKSPVARSFCALLSFVLVVYVGDVVLPSVETFGDAVSWLRFQWLGIAFIPAAYLHFSDALLRTTNAISPLRHKAVLASYVVSAFLFGLACFTNLLVQDGVQTAYLARLAAGPLFWLFTLYFFLTVGWGAFNIQRARHRCLTATSRRRMTYLAVAFAAPGLGVFPYLLLAGSARSFAPHVVLLLALAANVGVAMMLVVMGYSVAYFGVLTPDRVIKHTFIHYLLRGPFVGTCVVILMLTIPRAERILGLPRDVVLVFSVLFTIVLLQVLVNVVKPFIDRLIYRQDQEEVTWIQELDKRLLTTTDLRQFMENILASLCELFRVETGFVVIRGEKGIEMEAACGPRRLLQNFLRSQDWAFWLERLEANRDKEWIVQSGYWLFPLWNSQGETLIGFLGVEAPSEEFEWGEQERETVRGLLIQVEKALEDRHLQQGIFATLKAIIPEIEEIQRWRGTIRYAGEPLAGAKAGKWPYGVEFQQWVKDALSHYWGGPKLSHSPLLRLKVVENALEANGGNPVKALRAVLRQAIEALRPEGERSLTAAEWTLYNILEMRFIQGRKVKEIAAQLAMSESDLYRKQRLAIEQVARTLANMEKRFRERREDRS